MKWLVLSAGHECSYTRRIEKRKARRIGPDNGNAAASMQRDRNAVDANKALVRRYYEDVVNTGAVDDVAAFVSRTWSDMET